MSVAFPGESADYRAARDHLLEQEIELRRAMEAVAAARPRSRSTARCSNRAPKGRNEGDPPEVWIRRHDEY
jgi:predicted dithiol-disulfide oxidoreductase (DUF899 family)